MCRVIVLLFLFVASQVEKAANLEVELLPLKPCSLLTGCVA